MSVATCLLGAAQPSRRKQMAARSDRRLAQLCTLRFQFLFVARASERHTVVGQK